MTFQCSECGEICENVDSYSDCCNEPVEPFNPRERIVTVGVTCSDCPPAGRCADCQESIDFGVAAARAAGIAERHINPAA